MILYWGRTNNTTETAIYRNKGITVQEAPDHFKIIAMVEGSPKVLFSSVGNPDEARKIAQLYVALQEAKITIDNLLLDTEVVSAPDITVSELLLTLAQVDQSNTEAATNRLVETVAQVASKSTYRYPNPTIDAAVQDALLNAEEPEEFNDPGYDEVERTINRLKADKVRRGIVD